MKVRITDRNGSIVLTLVAESHADFKALVDLKVKAKAKQFLQYRLKMLPHESELLIALAKKEAKSHTI